MRINIIRNSQIKTQERRSKSAIKRNRGRPKEIKNARNILKKSNRRTLRDRNYIYRYLNIIVTQTLIRNGVRNSGIIIDLD
jgi:hypothetical protein